MQVTISFWCRTPDGVRRKPGDVVEVDELPGQMLIRDGLAQPLPESVVEPEPVAVDPPAAKPRLTKPRAEPEQTDP